MPRMQMQPLDPRSPIQTQFFHEVGPLVLVNVFTLDPADEAAFRRAWERDAAHMKSRPGLISIQLHKAVGDAPAYLNTAVWESVDLFRAAFTSDEFQARLDDYPESVTASPHLFQRVAVPGICTA